MTFFWIDRWTKSIKKTSNFSPLCYSLILSSDVLEWLDFGVLLSPAAGYQQIFNHCLNFDKRFEALHFFFEISHVLRETLALSFHILDIDSLIRCHFPIVNAWWNSKQSPKCAFGMDSISFHQVRLVGNELLIRAMLCPTWFHKWAQNREQLKRKDETMPSNFQAIHLCQHN